MGDLASQLNERVAIKQAAAMVDELGGQTVTWNTLAFVWAQVEPVGSTRARETGAQREGQAGYRVRMRIRDDVKASMRLLWRTRTLTIHSLHERGEILEILAYEEGL